MGPVDDSCRPADANRRERSRPPPLLNASLALPHTGPLPEGSAGVHQANGAATAGPDHYGTVPTAARYCRGARAAERQSSVSR